MIKSKWLIHPLFIFIFSLVAIITSLFIYIRSYLKVHQAFLTVVAKYHINPGQFLETETWVVILIMSVLFAIIMAGLIIVFVYYNKVIQLYRLQQNFINGFTHELKTPIASLQLFLETFTKHELSREDQLHYFEFMRRDTKRLSENVNRILHLGKLEDKSFKASFSKVNIVNIVEGFLRNTPHLFEETQIEFESNIKDLEMNIDKNLFEMLLMNLINNAIIYNNSSVKIVKLNLKAENKKLLFSVSDNGNGIEKEELKKVFKKFYQIGKTAKGSGLGLYIVQNIVRLHRGEITAISQGAGTGTTFIMEFKL